jgi:hypothetical protein
VSPKESDLLFFDAVCLWRSWVQLHAVEWLSSSARYEQVRKCGRSSLVNQPIGRTLAADEDSGVTKKEQCSEAVLNEPIPTFPDGQVNEE